MRSRRGWPAAAFPFLFLSLLLPGALPAAGQREITLDEALALARVQGAAGVAEARGRVEEARVRLERGRRRLQEDPELEMSGGYRNSETGFFDFEAALSQKLESGGRSAARTVGVEAALETAEAERAEAERLLLAEVRAAFARALAARDRAALQARGRDLADRLLAATDRGYEAGEVAALEWNRTRTASAAARAGQRAAEAELAESLAVLQGLLGLDPGEPTVVSGVRGDLAPGPLPDLPPLLAVLDRRPDLAALAAGLREAEAQVQIGRALGRPGLSVRGGVAREEGAEIATAGVVVSLPLRGAGREAVAVGEARAAALRQAMTAARSQAEAEVRGLHAALAARIEAVRELETAALPALDDGETLSLKSYEAGETGLGELLLIRREILETRLTYLDRLLDAALTRASLESAAGEMP